MVALRPVLFRRVITAPEPHRKTRVSRHALIVHPNVSEPPVLEQLSLPARRGISRRGLRRTAAWRSRRPGDDRRFASVAFLLADSGVSVVSDIDDTVKISEVRDKQKLLRNTFMHEFQAVPGMADTYRTWAAAGAAFHYVSASPWQLFDPLDAFFKAASFPAGSLHLKQFRWKDSSFFSLFQDPVAYKKPIIAGLLTRYPHRRFVLVGDSGEASQQRSRHRTAMSGSSIVARTCASTR